MLWLLFVGRGAPFKNTQSHFTKNLDAIPQMQLFWVFFGVENEFKWC